MTNLMPSDLPPQVRLPKYRTELTDVEENFLTTEFGPMSGNNPVLLYGPEPVFIPEIRKAQDEAAAWPSTPPEMYEPRFPRLPWSPEQKQQILEEWNANSRRGS